MQSSIDELTFGHKVMPWVFNPARKPNNNPRRWHQWLDLCYSKEPDRAQYLSNVEWQQRFEYEPEENKQTQTFHQEPEPRISHTFKIKEVR